MADMPLRYGNVGNATPVEPLTVPTNEGASAGGLLPRAPAVKEPEYVTPEVRDKASMWESAKASFGINTFLGQTLTALDQEEYRTDTSLDKKKFIKDLSVKLGTVPNDEELEFLMKGVNEDDMLNRWELLKQKEEKAQVASDHSVVAFGAAMLDPLDIAVGVLTGGLGKAASAGRVASKLQRGALGVTVGGAAAGGISTEIAEYVPLSDTDIALNVLAGAIGGAVDFRPWVKYQKPTNSVALDASQELDELGRAKGQVLDVPAPVPPVTTAFDATKSTDVFAPDQKVRVSLMDIPESTAEVLEGGRVKVIESMQGAALHSTLVRQGKVVIPKDAKVAYIPEDDVLFIVKGSENDKHLILGELGIKAVAERVLGHDTVQDMIDHVYNQATRGNADAIAALDFVKNNPAITKDIAALAKYVETLSHKDNLYTTIVGKFRVWLRKLGLNMEITDAEVLALAKQSLRNAPDRGVYLPKGDVVYHGSAVRGIEEFQLKFAGSGEGNASFGFGHYVSTNKGLANIYRSVASTINKVSPETQGTVYALRKQFRDSETLDFDKTVQQPIAAKAIAELGAPTGTGKQQYDWLAEKLGSQKAASDALLKLGVKGNKFLTGAARKGKGEAYNYVVFSDEGLKVLKDFSVPREVQYTESLDAFGQAQEQYLKEVDAYNAKLEADPESVEPPPVAPVLPNPPEMPDMMDLVPNSKPASTMQRFKATAPEELKALQSFHDAVTVLGTKGKALANLILANPIDNKGLSATTVQRNFMLDGEKRLMPLEKALKELGLYDKSRKAGGNAAVRTRRRQILSEVQDWMHRARRAELAANPEPNLGLKAQDQINLEDVELPQEYKDLTYKGDVQWFHMQDDLGDTLLHGYDSVKQEVFRLYEVPDSADEVVAKAGTTAVGTPKPKREAWVLTAQGKWAPKKEVLRDAARAEADPTYQAKWTVLKQSPTEFLKWKQWMLGLTDEGLAEVQAFKSGTYGQIEPHLDPAVRKIVDAITEMNFAEETLRRAKQNGVEGANGTEFSKYYIPMVHDFDRIRDMVRVVGMDNIADAYGTQLLRMMPSLKGKANLKRQMGMQFLAGIQGGKTGDKLLKRAAAQEFDGLGRDDIMILLRNVGFNDVEIAKGMENMFGKPSKDSVGAVTTALRNRNDWDLEEVFSTPDGDQFKLGDFLNADLDANLAKYNLQMSSRTGLARVGIRSGAELQTLLDDVFEEAVANGTTPEKARQVLDHLRDTVLGRPTGEPVAEWVRSLNTVGSALQLANSALYNIAELALIQKEHGIKMMAKHSAAIFKGSGIEKLTKADATTLTDIVSGRIITEGRMRPIVHHLDDNFEGAVGSMHETISWAGQSVRFLNGSEHMRRGMIALNTAILEDRLLKALGGNVKDVKYFKSLGMSDELLARVKSEVDTHGTHMERWNSFTSDELTTYLISATDNTVMAIRRGERPMFMDSSVGKILFPYMSFVFASHNKVLRRTVKNDGYTGLGMLMLYQTPLAVLAASATNVTAGKEWDEGIEAGTVKALSGVGMFAIPFDLITRGRLGGASPVFAPFNALSGLAQEPFKDDPSMLNVVKNTPFVSINPALRAAASGLDK